MDESAPKESIDKEVTDEQSFRQMVELFADRRPSHARRKLPRFPTPAALTGHMDSRGFDGALVCEAGTHGLPSRRYLALVTEDEEEHRVRGIHIVDFSEEGFQLHLRCDDFRRLSGSTLFLELPDARVPVLLRWCKQAQPQGRAGFSFAERIDCNGNLMRAIADLSTSLVEFLVNGFKQGRLELTKQSAVFAFLVIYYSLRLEFLEEVAAINDLIGMARGDDQPEVYEAVNELLAGFQYSSTYHVEQAAGSTGDPEFIRLIGTFMRPFYECGCGLLGTAEDVVFLKSDVLAAVVNSILFVKGERQSQVAVSPSLSSLYRCFIDLRRLFPGMFEHRQFELQFRYYSAIIDEMDMFRDGVVDCLSHQSGMQSHIGLQVLGSLRT